MNKTLLISVCLFLSASVLCHADGPELSADSITSAPDSIDAQTALRLNPDIYDDCRTGSFLGGARPDYSEYTFLQQDAGHIELNGADWSQLSERFAAAQRGEALFPVVYLGDSHVQADFGGAILRSRLAEVAGSAGRGIIIPYRLASTNEPGDYSFRLAEDYVASKLMKMPWATEMPFTGVGVKPLADEFGVDLSCRTSFDRLRFLYSGEIPQVTTLTVGADTVAPLAVTYAPGQVSISLPDTVGLLRVGFRPSGPMVIAGADLYSGQSGTLVHSVGNNGATFSSYGLVGNFGAGLASLSPALVVIALGTNEAFGNVSDETMLNNIDNLVGNIRRHNPSTALLLVTPTECFRKIYRRRGKNRRRSAVTVVNTRTARMRQAIADYARLNNIPLYDTYALAGGDGAAQSMRKAKVLSADGVHFSAAGYRLWGNLLADALLEILSPSSFFTWNQYDNSTR